MSIMEFEGTGGTTVVLQVSQKTSSSIIIRVRRGKCFVCEEKETAV